MTNTSDPYAAVIADLKRRRDEIDEMIARLEAMRGGKAAPATAEDDSAPKSDSETRTTTPDMTEDSPFLGMNIVAATKILLAQKRKPMRAPDIAQALESGGLILSGKSKANTVGSVLNRRQSRVGDIVSPKRGQWGLKDWYPNRNFGKKSDEASDNEGQLEPNETNEPEQPSEQLRIVPGGSTD